MFRTISVMLVCTVGGSAAAVDCVTTLHPTADARIMSMSPDTRSPADILSTFNGSGNEQRTVLKFSLARIPPGATLHSATLRLYGRSYYGSHSQTSIRAYRVERDWLESDVTWNTAVVGQPWVHPGGDFVGTDGVYLGNPYAIWTGAQSSPEYAWYELDVTALVTELFQGVHLNQRIGLGSPAGCELTYMQRENAENPPELVISYTAALVPGDLNCDCNVDFADINPFVLYLSNYSVWQATYPDCPPGNGDINGDGTYGQGSFGDINPLVALLSSGG